VVHSNREDEAPGNGAPGPRPGATPVDPHLPDDPTARARVAAHAVGLLVGARAATAILNVLLLAGLAGVWAPAEFALVASAKDLAARERMACIR